MAEWMRTERVRVREAQDDVAKAIGKSRSWVATVERGETSDRVRVEDCVLIAAHFGKPLRSVLKIAGYSAREIAGITAADEALTEVLEGIEDPITIHPDDLQALVEAATDRALRAVLQEFGLPAPALPTPRGSSGAPVPVPGSTTGSPAAHVRLDRTPRKRGGQSSEPRVPAGGADPLSL